MDKAKQWARENGSRYGITGEVQEWAYKNGLDNDPSIGMSLKFVDLETDQILWTATGTRTGWGFSNLSSTADKTISELLSEVRFNNNVRGIPALAAAKDGSVVLSKQPSNAVTAPIRPDIVDLK